MAEENFLEGFMRLNDGTEVPDAFAMWCGISAVSAALGRNVWLRFGQEAIYPNLFVLLVAGSATQRKSTAIGRAEKLLKLMSPAPNIIAQKVTPEALIQSLRKVETKDMKQLLKETCTGIVVADEMATFLNKKSYEAGLASLLIQMYDCKDQWVYRTVSRQEERLENLCLGLLAGSTVDWIRSGIPEEAVGGGLTSRIIFVYVDTPANPVAFPEWTAEHEAIRERLARQLQQISTIQGEFQLTAQAKEMYKQEYDEFFLKTGEQFKSDKTLSGYFGRRHMHMLKLSMIFSAAESLNRVVNSNHMLAAKTMLIDVERFLKHVLSLITSSNHGSEMQNVAMYIRTKGTVSRTDLIRAFSSRIQSRQMTEIIDTLISVGSITPGFDTRGGQNYTWTGGMSV